MYTFPACVREAKEFLSDWRFTHITHYSTNIRSKHIFIIYLWRPGKETFIYSNVFKTATATQCFSDVGLCLGCELHCCLAPRTSPQLLKHTDAGCHRGPATLTPLCVFTIIVHRHLSVRPVLTHKRCCVLLQPLTASGRTLFKLLRLTCRATIFNSLKRRRRRRRRQKGEAVFHIAAVAAAFPGFGRKHGRG